MTNLKRAAWIYAIGTTLHTIDHFRRGAGSTSWELVEVGTAGTILAAIVITLILTEHRLAPTAAVSVGFAHGLGIAAVHWLPRWSVLSDSFFDWSAGPISWTAVTLEVAGAIGVGVAGAIALRRSRAGSPDSPSPQPIEAARA
jgi:hypothetical protein